MVRINITVADDVGKELKRIKNKSQFITQTLREKFLAERKKATERILEEAYKKAAKEDALFLKDLDGVSSDGIE